jgi:S-sulfo-L-cysteine synthase (O-acetyl-L-serine-dependent)
MNTLTLEQVRSHPMFQALDPSGKPFMLKRTLPPELNLVSRYDIEVAALIPFGMLPHIKSIPALQMMCDDFVAGRYEGMHTIVIDSSGNTAHAVALLASAFGFEDVKIVLAADVTQSKKEILAALSTVEIIEVPKGKSVAARAIEEASKPGHYHLNQYAHPGNPKGHALYTGPEILRLLGDRVAIVAAALGSSGTALGVANFFEAEGRDVTVLGVRPADGEQVPGARDARRMDEVVTLPWKEKVPIVVPIARKESFLRMRQMWQYFYPQPGPTSGMAWAGLMHHLASFTPQELKRYGGKCAAFICPDDGRFYSERTTGELDPDQGIAW